MINKGEVMNIRVNNIMYNKSLVDGPGIRTVMFCQGCDMRCTDCHNKESWDINGGTNIDIKYLETCLREKCINKKLTISGGEPLLQLIAVEQLIDLIPDFDIVLYTGRELEDVPASILSKISYIKTGAFEKDKKTTLNEYIGSTNQKFINLKEGIK